MVDFKKLATDKKTKLAGKTLSGEPALKESPFPEHYQEGHLYNIPIECITPDPNQPRKSFDQVKLNELANSIKSKGVLQPIIIRKNDQKKLKGDFLVVAGERRYRASKIAELKTIPAIFTYGDPEEIALIENLLRDDLNPIEEAEAFHRIMQSHNYSQGQLSEIVGKGRTTINETLRLVELPDNIKDRCRTSDISKNVLLEIAKRKSIKEINKLFEKAISEGLTVAKIRKITRPKPPKQTRDLDERILVKATEMTQLLSKIEKEKLHKQAQPSFWQGLKNLRDSLDDILK